MLPSGPRMVAWVMGLLSPKVRGAGRAVGLPSGMRPGLFISRGFRFFLGAVECKAVTTAERKRGGGVSHARNDQKAGPAAGDSPAGIDERPRERGAHPGRGSRLFAGE